ncbi:hypothetical protein ykris0001_14990 [Yersinia kristensenii ATCC 33638]|nr:hypothetical protein ykris0001_14990 [Yersinia kristensenii ATCC 33638]
MLAALSQTAVNLLYMTDSGEKSLYPKSKKPTFENAGLIEMPV